MNTLQSYESLSSLTNMSKAELSTLSERQAEEIKEAGTPEQAYAFLSKVKTLIDGTIDKIKEDAISEVSKGNNNAFGVSMKVQPNVRYEYKHDPTWVKLKKSLSDYEELMKDKLGKYANMNMVDEEGELKDVKPAVKKSSDYIKTEF